MKGMKNFAVVKIVSICKLNMKRRFAQYKQYDKLEEEMKLPYNQWNRILLKERILRRCRK